MSVHRYLDCGTSHITREEADSLAGIGGYTVVTAHDYGWWVWVPELVTAEEAATFTAVYPNVAAILGRARRARCTWVNLDADGPSVPGLPTFDW